MNTHLFLVHFPVALLVVAAIVEVVGFALDSPGTRQWAWRLTLAGAVAALFAFATGESARLALLAGDTEPLARAAIHEQWAGAGVWVIALGALIRSLWRGREEAAYRWACLAVVLAMAALTVAITVTGTLVRHA